MGGGAAMRAASKVAGISSFTNTFRTGVVSSREETTPVARKAVKPISASVTDGGVKIEEAVQRPAWELDGWEYSCFDDDVELFVSDKNEQIVPRFVFGSVPTLEETKDATSELKDALHTLYLSSPKSSESTESFSSVHEIKTCITHTPNTATMQAFKLLNESDAAQTVVASIASDPNVWKAVMQNPTLMEFLESDIKYVDSETEEPLKSSVDFESKELAAPKSSIENDDAEKSGNPGSFMRLVHNVKITVVEMVTKLTSYVEGFISPPDVEKKGETSNDSSTGTTTMLGGSFLAMAIMVIMVVLLKRN